MKKTLFTMFGLCLSSLAFAQWSGTSPIYYNGGNVGIGTGSPSFKLHIVGETYSSSAFKVGETAQITQDALFNGYRGSLSTSSVYGVKVLRYLSSSTANTGGIYGLHVISGPSFTSSTTNTYGIYTQAKTFSSGTTTNAYSLYSESPTGSITNAFNIYAAGGTKSYFGGSVGIGTTSPAYKLHVNGSTYTQGLYSSTAIHIYSPQAGNTNKRVTINTLEGNNAFIYNYDELAQTFHNMNFGGQHGLNSGVTVLASGQVGIGISSPEDMLEVNGTIRSKKVKVDANGWPDYVFAANYQLPTLSEIESFIQANGHLPEVPSAKEVEQNGLDVGDMEATLLKKVEEMTLYMIEKDKQVESLKSENQELKSRLAQIEEFIKSLKH